MWNDRFHPHTLDYLEPLFSHFLTVILLALADLSILTRFFFSFLTNIVQSMADSGASHRLDLRVGGKYRLGKKIGSGSFGVLHANAKNIPHS
jgi:hypothetical protein